MLAARLTLCGQFVFARRGNYLPPRALVFLIFISKQTRGLFFERNIPSPVGVLFVRTPAFRLRTITIRDQKAQVWPHTHFLFFYADNASVGWVHNP